ncbi:MAG: hypothetical protein VZS44_02115 [Bacilli bacterium]|nr:hypothetical protein [Bacilli bacterium]
MKKKNNSGFLIGLLIGIIIMLIIGICLLATGTISLKNESKKKTADNKQVTNEEKIEEEISEETSTNLIIEGTYTITSEGETGYYTSTANITNYTNSTIEFSISTAKGIDKEHVNIGEVKGTAKKTNENEYIFEETENGKTSKIIFKFSHKGTSQYLTIEEEYPDYINPYAGHGVYFAAEYQKEL